MKHLNRFLLLVSLLLCYTPDNHLSAQKGKGIPNPKNIIFLIGDGMGYNHIKATNYYLGIAQQVYEHFPVQFAVAHYPAKVGEYKANSPGSNYFSSGYNPHLAWKDTAYVKKDYTESAAAATALSTGIKTYNNSIGMSLVGDSLLNLVQWAKRIGKSAGVVTSVPFSHATPAGFVAHNATRTQYAEIAWEMLLDSRCDVIMGCGDPMYDEDGLFQDKKWKNSKYVGDSVFWQEFIAGSGKQIKFKVNGSTRIVGDINNDGRPDPWTVIRSVDEFRALQYGKTPARVLGCAKVYSTLQQGRTMKNGETKDSPPFITPFIETVPTLANMVGGALNVLDNNRKGFFIMIEGGATDWASHSNQKGRLIEEMTGFNEAIQVVVTWVNAHSSWDETLVIVTGDHETGFLWGGDPFIPVKDQGKDNLPLMKYNSTDHTNSLLPFFAKGSGSELYRNWADECDSVRGSFIQNSEIAQLIHLLWGE